MPLTTRTYSLIFVCLSDCDCVCHTGAKQLNRLRLGPPCLLGPFYVAIAVPSVTRFVVVVVVVVVDIDIYSYRQAACDSSDTW